MATLMGRFSRVPPVIEADEAAPPPAGLASPPPAGWPKSSRETVPSARFSGASTEVTLARTP